MRQSGGIFIKNYHPPYLPVEAHKFVNKFYVVRGAIDEQPYQKPLFLQDLRCLYQRANYADVPSLQFAAAFTHRLMG